MWIFIHFQISLKLFFFFYNIFHLSFFFYSFLLKNKNKKIQWTIQSKSCFDRSGYDIIISAGVRKMSKKYLIFYYKLFSIFIYGMTWRPNNNLFPLYFHLRVAVNLSGSVLSLTDNHWMKRIRFQIILLLLNFFFWYSWCFWPFGITTTS